MTVAEEDSFDFDSPPRRQPAARPSAATPQPNATAKRAAGVGAVPQTPRQFRAGREASACAWLAHFDAQVFGGQLAGRVDLKWSNTLRSTAGLCRMMSVKHPANKAAAATTERRAVVELAGKVRARLFAPPSALVRLAARISPSPLSLPLFAGGGRGAAAPRNAFARALPRRGVGRGRQPEAAARPALLRLGPQSDGSDGLAGHALPRLRHRLQAHVAMRGLASRERRRPQRRRQQRGACGRRKRQWDPGRRRARLRGGHRAALALGRHRETGTRGWALYAKIVDASFIFSLSTFTLLPGTQNKRCAAAAGAGSSTRGLPGPRAAATTHTAASSPGRRSGRRARLRSSFRRATGRPNSRCSTQSERACTPFSPSCKSLLRSRALANSLFYVLSKVFRLARASPTHLSPLLSGRRLVRLRSLSGYHFFVAGYVSLIFFPALSGRRPGALAAARPRPTRRFPKWRTPT
jgi:hypothetical protein